MNESQYSIDVPGIGKFTFRGRVSFRDAGRIGGEYYDFCGGIEPPKGSWLDAVASAYSEMKVLTVAAPDGWNLDTLDPQDQDSYRKFMEVSSARRAEEARFRGGSEVGGKAGG